MKVMRFQPAHQSMINRRFDGCASSPARKSPGQALARKPPIHAPASGKGGHQSGLVTSRFRANPRLLKQSKKEANAAAPENGQNRAATLIVCGSSTKAQLT